MTCGINWDLNLKQYFSVTRGKIMSHKCSHNKSLRVIFLQVTCLHGGTLPSVIDMICCVRPTQPAKSVEPVLCVHIFTQKKTFYSFLLSPHPEVQREIVQVCGCFYKAVPAYSEGRIKPKWLGLFKQVSYF